VDEKVIASALLRRGFDVLAVVRALRARRKRLAA
jgi:hypothetical protein